MANKRMFTMHIVDSDAFLDMPLSTQCLYLHLNMRADDDGFIGNPKRIQRLIGASEDDLKLLIAKRFVLTFEGGVIVIKHWRMHNTIRGDRYIQTQYKEELSMLTVKDNKSYSLSGIENSEVSKRLPSGCQNVSTDIGLGLDIGLDIDKEKDIVQPSSKEARKVNKTDIDNFFERVWKLYPSKKGKGQVKDTQKKRLYDIGYEELERAISRYTKELAKDSAWRKPQNGSTFFNSGYIDYLDSNYAGGNSNELQQPDRPNEKETSRYSNIPMRKVRKKPVQ